MSIEPRKFLDTFTIFSTADLVRGEIAESITCLGREVAAEAVTAFKKQPVTVMRVTEGFAALDVTDEFVAAPEPECDEVEHWTRAHTRKMTRIGAFGTR